MVFLLTDYPQKLKVEKIHGILTEFSLTTDIFFLIKNTKYSLESDWSENTKSSFKQNARTFSKN